MLEPTPVRVELVARNPARPNAAGDRPQLAGPNQRANVVLGAFELGGKLSQCQWGRAFDAPKYRGNDPGSVRATRPPM